LPGLESRDVHEEIPERMPVQGLEQPIILKISPLVIDTIITLLLSDYVMHDHTKNHDLPHLYNPLLPSRVNNGPTRWLAVARQQVGAAAALATAASGMGW
jgi:hypothetical protein